jgi:hypothetical protein
LETMLLAAQHRQTVISSRKSRRAMNHDGGPLRTRRS